MELLDPAKIGLESGPRVDEYDYQIQRQLKTIRKQLLTSILILG